MRKVLFILSLFTATICQAQSKDTTVQVTVSIEQFRGLLAAIDGNIDSKKASKEIVDFLLKSAAVLPPKKDTTFQKPIKK